MASGAYESGVGDLIAAFNITSDTLKVMLVKIGYVYNPDDDVVDGGGANDPLDHELTVAGYTGGWGGAGRKTVTVGTQKNTTDNRWDVGFNDLTWTGLGTGETIAGAILIKEGGANDTTSRLIAYWDLTDTPTNGGDITLDFTAAASGGNLRFAV